MENSPKSTPAHSLTWYLVCLDSGATAVTVAEDLHDLIRAGTMVSAIIMTHEMGRKFEENRARAGYMSATCRLKSGESDRVG